MLLDLDVQWIDLDHKHPRATLIGILCGSIIGYNFAEEDMENAIKDKLFNAFKNNNLYNNRK